MEHEPSPLLSAVEEFITRYAMSPVTFGRKAVGDPHLVRDLRGHGTKAPRRVWPETEKRVRDFMRGHDAVAVCSLSGCNRRADDPAAQCCGVRDCPFAVKEAA